ncbi:MAG: radical SAM protein [Thiobacillaceae bacterium]|jgi:wyosine [tRNA(Phe)-imidazoG37] synthetase (radical SAM superfamily)|nr:radical SAM protein [Thiobacillaceae bacterium]
MAELNITDHSRDAAGMTYVYPVLSRRSRGVSVGVNLNPNNACNWRCVYCQVPDLARGGPPPIDLDRLEAELRRLLADIVHGDYLARHAPEGMRRLNDVAFSGNGEPTTAREFPEAVERVGRVLADLGLIGSIRLVLISNGSQMGRARVQAGLRRLAILNGEVWFKLDRATRAGMRQVNQSDLSPERAYAHLRACAALCPTWLQTCVFALDGAPPAEAEIRAYLDLLARAGREGVPLRGVLLYGLARPSLQPEAPRLSRLPETWLQGLAARIAALGLVVETHP